MQCRYAVSNPSSTPNNHSTAYITTATPLSHLQSNVDRNTECLVRVTNNLYVDTNFNELRHKVNEGKIEKPHHQVNALDNGHTSKNNGECIDYDNLSIVLGPSMSSASIVSETKSHIIV